MTAPDVGNLVVLTDLDSDPRLLVTAVDDDTDDVTGVLLADLAAETIHRLEASMDDHQRRQQVTTAVRRADELMTFRVPVDELRRWDPPATEQPVSTEGGR